MNKNIFKKKSPSGYLGMGLNPGDDHYRAYVGPAEDYDMISAMVFNLITCLGLRQHHKVLDIGCGSLRTGRLLIPYLNKNNYIGVEPNKWLVNDGITNELGTSILKTKKPTFLFKDSIDSYDFMGCDYAIAQSIFSHCSIDLIDKWLFDIEKHLAENGILLATFLVGKQDFKGKGWVYPDCVEYEVKTIAGIAQKNNFYFKLINWWHPRQQWALFIKSESHYKKLEAFDIRWSKEIYN